MLTDLTTNYKLIYINYSLLNNGLGNPENVFIDTNSHWGICFYTIKGDSSDHVYKKIKRIRFEWDTRDSMIYAFYTFDLTKPKQDYEDPNPYSGTESGGGSE